MTQRELSALSLRLVAVVALFGAGPALTSGVEAATSNMRRYHVYSVTLGEQVRSNGALGLFAALGPCVGICLLSLALWCLADGLAYFLAGRTERSGKTIARGLRGSDAATVLFTAAGLYGSVTSLSALGALLDLFWAQEHSETGMNPFSLGLYGVQLLSALLPLGVGLLLVFKARTLAESTCVPRIAGPTARS